jgi:excisionase family DNA binding protein
VDLLYIRFPYNARKRGKIMHVAEFLEHKKMTQDEFSRLCGVSKSTMTYWQAGKSIPCKSHMAMITKITKGLVTLQDIKAFVEERNHEMLPIAAAARMLRIRNASVLRCIRSGKLHAAKIGKKWFVPVEAVELYKKNKYNPEYLTTGGKSIWNVTEGRLSPTHVAKMLGVTLQTIYKMLKQGSIEGIMINGYHVITSEEVERIKNNVEELRPVFLHICMNISNSESVDPAKYIDLIKSICDLSKKLLPIG